MTDPVETEMQRQKKAQQKALIHDSPGRDSATQQLLSNKMVQAVAVTAATATVGIIIGFVANINANLSDMKGEIKSMQNKYDERTSSNVNELISTRARLQILSDTAVSDERRLSSFESRMDELLRRSNNVMNLLERLGGFSARLSALEEQRREMQTEKVIGRLDALEIRMNNFGNYLVRRLAKDGESWPFEKPRDTEIPRD